MNPIRLFLAFFLIILISEWMPEAVNAILVLVLVGILLGNWKSFSGLFNFLGKGDK
jgi:hypothetical protein